MKKILEKLKYLLPFIGAYLGSLGGQGVKEWRRVVLPIVLSIIGAISLQSYWGILLGTFGIWTAMGYGIPEAESSEPNAIFNPQFIIEKVLEWKDEGSTLGRFFYCLFRGNHLLADIFTRGTIALGMCLTGLVCPILKQNWLMYLLGCLSIMIGQTVFSYRGWGEVKVFGTNLLVSDLINYALIFVGYTSMLI